MAPRFDGKIASMRVFISYRRDDSMVTAALLYRELTSRPEFADAFMDIDDIGYGDDFVAAIDRAHDDADVVVVVIGPKWTEMLQARLRSDDWVRHEVARALALRARAPGGSNGGLRVVPVLIGGAAPPPASALPGDLAELARLGMLKFDERALQASVNSLLEAIRGERFEQEIDRIGKERRVRLASAALGLALFLAALMGVLDFLGLDARSATATMLLARVVAPAPEWGGQVVLVAIDEASERAIGRPFDPSWRAEHAIVIERAASAGARSVAFDLVFEDPGSDPANAALAAALAATREKMPVIFGVQHLGAGGAPSLLAAFSPLAHQGLACAGVALGQGYSMPLALRRAAPAASAAAASAVAAGRAERSAAPLPSLALAAYIGRGGVELVDEKRQTLLVRAGARGQRQSEEIRFYQSKTIDDAQRCDLVQPGDRAALQLLDPYALPPLREAPQRVAYERIVAGAPDALALLSGRIVVVGATLAGRDRIPLPWPAADRWGVELHAAQADQLARKVAIRRIHPLIEWALVTGFALLGATCAARLRHRSLALRIGVPAAIALAWIAVSIAWYRSEHQLIGVPYDLAALALGAWLANRIWRRPTA